MSMTQNISYMTENSAICSLLHQLFESQIQRGKDFGSGVRPEVQVHAGVQIGVLRKLFRTGFP